MANNKNLSIMALKATNPAICTYTMCECGENHVGNQQIGQIASKEDAFNLLDFQKALKNAEEMGCQEGRILHLNQPLTEVDLTNNKGEIVEAEDAYLLVLTNMIRIILAKAGKTMADLYKEIMAKKWDTKVYSQKHKNNGKGGVVNKNARHNNVLADFSQEADYPARKGTIHNFKDMPLMSLIREAIFKIFGKKAHNLIAEGNLYPDGGAKKHGIGFHGDLERRLVVGLRIQLTKKSMPMHYQWYLDRKRIGPMIIIPLNGGDIYAKSMKTVGTDWKKQKIPTIRHATGALKFTK